MHSDRCSSPAHQIWTNCQSPNSWIFLQIFHVYGHWLLLVIGSPLVFGFWLFRSPSHLLPEHSREIIPFQYNQGCVSGETGSRPMLFMSGTRNHWCHYLGCLHIMKLVQDKCLHICKVFLIQTKLVLMGNRKIEKPVEPALCCNWIQLNCFPAMARSFMLA